MNGSSSSPGLLRTPNARDGEPRGSQHPAKRLAGGHQPSLADQVEHLLPTPAVNDMGDGKTVEAWDDWTDAMRARHGNGNGHGKSLSIEAQRLPPTPRATDGTKGGPNQRGSSGDLMLPSAVTLLPTPAVNDMGEGKSVTAWDEWTARMKSAHGNGNGHGASLAIEAQRVADELQNGDDHAIPTQGGPGEVLRGVRGEDDAEAVQRTAGGPNPIHRTADLRAELREHEARGGQGHSPLAGTEAFGGCVSGVWDDGAATRPSHRPQPREQRDDQPGDTVCVVPPQTSLAGGSGEAACGCAPWGDYAPAIHRWELIIGRPAPAPTEPTGRDGARRLSVRAVEWMMGLPAGHVTGVPGVKRSDQLRALGNGVVLLQAAAALRYLLAVRAWMRREGVAA